MLQTSPPEDRRPLSWGARGTLGVLALVMSYGALDVGAAATSQVQSAWVHPLAGIACTLLAFAYVLGACHLLVKLVEAAGAQPGTMQPETMQPETMRPLGRHRQVRARSRRGAR